MPVSQALVGQKEVLDLQSKKPICGYGANGWRGSNMRTCAHNLFSDSHGERSCFITRGEHPHLGGKAAGGEAEVTRGLARMYEHI